MAFSEIATLKDNYKKFDKKIKFNNRIIMKIETEFTTKKKELKVLIHAKKTYLSELLKRGKDIRDDGLTWIIRKLMHMGVVVYQNDLPESLDQKAKEFLIARSQKQQDLTELETLLSLQLDMYKANMNLCVLNKGWATSGGQCAQPSRQDNTQNLESDNDANNEDD